MKIEFADRMKDYEEGIFQVLNEKKIEREKAGKRGTEVESYPDTGSQ